MRRAEADPKSSGPPDARYMRRGLSTVKVGVPKEGAEYEGIGRTIRVCRLTKGYRQGWLEEGINGGIRSGACAALPRPPPRSWQRRRRGRRGGARNDALVGGDLA